MFCEKCGTELDDDAVFCHKCGSQVRDDVTEVYQKHKDTFILRTREKLDSKQLIIRAVSAVVIMISAFVIIRTASLRYGTRSPEDTVTDFFAYCNAMDMSAALNCLDPASAATYKATADMLLGLTNMGITTDTISELGGFFSEFNDDKMQILDMKTIYYENGKEVEDTFGFKKATAEDAEVICTFIMDDEEQTDTFVLHKYSGRWRIEGDN